MSSISVTQLRIIIWNGDINKERTNKLNGFLIFLKNMIEKWCIFNIESNFIQYLRSLQIFKCYNCVFMFSGLFYTIIELI